MKRIYLNSLTILCFLISGSLTLFAQNSCPTNSPTSFSVETDMSGNCFLVVAWISGEMPELTCGTPGTPASGSGSFSGKLIDLEFDGVYVYQNGNNCNGSLFNVEYHPTIPNAYRTTVSLCTTAGQDTTIFEANRTGSSNHTCVLYNNNPLPVELISFGAKEKDGLAVLEWATATEINNKQFIIERSADGKVFEGIGIVLGSGNSADEKSYLFVDETPLIGDNYYRLKQVDFDGKFEYSEVIVWYKTAQDKMSFYPTKIINHGTLYYETPAQGQVDILLLDIHGRVLRRESLELQKGSNRFELNLWSLPAGIYFISTVRSDFKQQTLTRRLIKME